MNMERSIPNNDPQQQPSSPKKKLHTKDKGSLSDTIANARASLKSGKDISARNLMDCAVRKPISRGPSFEFDPDLANEATESSTDEIVALDEEHTDFHSASGADGFNGDASDDDESIIEEIVEEYYEEEILGDDDDEDYTDGSLESLPPPIAIPKALQVKDSDDDDDSNDDGDDDDDSESLEDDDSQPSAVVLSNNKQQQGSKFVSSVTAKPNQSNVAKDTKSFHTVTPVEAKTTKLSTSPVIAVAPAKAASNKAESKLTLTNDVNEEIDRKVSSDSRRKDNDTANEDSKTAGSVWEKPDWTTNNRLKSTGASPTRSLAKPMTQPPELVNKKEMNDIKTPKKSNTKQAKLSLENTETGSMKYPKSPRASTEKVSISSTNAPKSAPQQDGGRPKYVVSTAPTSKDDNEDDFSSKIAWEKPEWAKKKVLRKTSKTETILSGGKLERPIGGIRPIE